MSSKEQLGFEYKETITFAEFQAWLTGLIVGKGGALPDLNDWKQIKKMMDKVVAEKEIITIPSESIRDPYRPYSPSPWTIPCSPHLSDPIWCSTSISTTIDNTYNGPLNDGSSVAANTNLNDLMMNGSFEQNSSSLSAEFNDQMKKTQIQSDYTLPHVDDEVLTELNEAFRLLFNYGGKTDDSTENS